MFRWCRCCLPEHHTPVTGQPVTRPCHVPLPSDGMPYPQHQLTVRTHCRSPLPSKACASLSRPSLPHPCRPFPPLHTARRTHTDIRTQTPTRIHAPTHAPAHRPPQAQQHLAVWEQEGVRVLPHPHLVVVRGVVRAALGAVARAGAGGARWGQDGVGGAFGMQQLKMHIGTCTRLTGV